MSRPLDQVLAVIDALLGPPEDTPMCDDADDNADHGENTDEEMAVDDNDDRT